MQNWIKMKCCKGRLRGSQAPLLWDNLVYYIWESLKHSWIGPPLRHTMIYATVL